MSLNLVSINHDLVYAHLFFIDLVGVSNPKTSTKTQIKKIETLHKLIKECDAYKLTNSENCIKIPTGDGMALAFLFDQQLPLKLALQLHKKFLEYNKGLIPSEIIQVRIGLHSGNVYLVKDINDNLALWGSGIILARRVMDLGDAEHILLTERMAKDLLEISDEYFQIIHEIQDFVIKHDQSICVFSAFGEGFGNSVIPQSGLKQGIKEEFTKLNKNTLYAYASATIRVKDPNTMLVQHTRTYEIINTSDRPIKSVIHGIGTDVKKTFDQLKINVYDENHNQMKIDRITMDYPFQKEFTTLFERSISNNEKGRKYTLEYHVEEPKRYYENTFMVDCKIFDLTFEYPKNSNLEHPVLYEINQETEEKTKSLISSTTIQNSELNKISWHLKNNSRGQTIRIEW